LETPRSGGSSSGPARAFSMSAAARPTWPCRPRSASEGRAGPSSTISTAP
jgi:hypothetical protein